VSAVTAGWVFGQLTALWDHFTVTALPEGPARLLRPVWRLSCWNVGHGMVSTS
jgi:hypothetical protein